VDTDGEEEYDEDEDAMMEVAGDDDGVAHLATFGLRPEPTLELPAPSGWKGEGEDEDEGRGRGAGIRG
jgi:hypothetical protein